MSMRNNENSSLCTACGGICCKSGAGGWLPEDLPQPITKEMLVDMLKNGYQFDWWEGNPTKDESYDDVTAYYLRPQHTNSLGLAKNGSWGGACLFLDEKKGCTKHWDIRPSQCRALVPSIGHPYDCKAENPDKYGKRGVCIAWLPYNSIIEDAIKEVENSE